MPTKYNDVTHNLPRGTERILLVEDNVSVRDLMARILGEQGYSILEAANANEALALGPGRSQEIQLLLTDVVMSGLSGKALAEQLRARYPQLKVLFVSGYANLTIVQDTMMNSGTYFLQKPFTPADLTLKVREALDAL